MPIGLFEWLGEAYNPGPLGSVQFGRQSNPNRTRGTIILCFGISSFALGLLYWLTFQLIPDYAALGNTLTALLVTILYCTAGYYIRPKPNIENLGWLGGLFDNPFRYSDDWNRFLLGWYVLLLPGRFIVDSIIDFVVMLCNLKPRDHSADPSENPLKSAIDLKRHPLYQNLLRKTRGDEKLAERLIQYEHQRSPSATREELIANAIARLERDNR